MDRKLYLIIGAQRSGKSFFSNELIEKYKAAGNSCLVYNLGRPSDFTAAKEIFLMTRKQHAAILGKAWKQNPNFEIYEDENHETKQFFNFSPDWTGRAAKAARISELNHERAFFDAFFQYVSNCLLVIDDARALFRYGVFAEFCTLFSRLNHSGRLNPVQNWRATGADVVIIFHSLDHVNAELFDYATHIINFKYAMAPNFDRIENAQLKEQLIKSFNAMEKAPQYSYTITDIKNLKTKIHIKKP